MKQRHKDDLWMSVFIIGYLVTFVLLVSSCDLVPRCDCDLDIDICVYLQDTSLTCDDVNKAINCYADNAPYYFHSTDGYVLRELRDIGAIYFYDDPLPCKYANDDGEIVDGMCAGLCWDGGVRIDVWDNGEGLYYGALFHEITHAVFAPNDFYHERIDVWIFNNALNDYCGAL